MISQRKASRRSCNRGRASGWHTNSRSAPRNRGFSPRITQRLGATMIASRANELRRGLAQTPWFGVCYFPTPASVPRRQVRRDLEPNLPERATHGKVSTRIRTARTPNPSFTVLAARCPSLDSTTWRFGRQTAGNIADGAYVPTLFGGMYAPLGWLPGAGSCGEAQTCQKTASQRRLPGRLNCPRCRLFQHFVNECLIGHRPLGRTTADFRE